MLARASGSMSLPALIAASPRDVDDYLLRADLPTLNKLLAELKTGYAPAALSLAVTAHLALLNMRGYLVISEVYQYTGSHSSRVRPNFNGCLQYGSDADGNPIYFDVNSGDVYTPFMENIYFANPFYNIASNIQDNEQLRRELDKNNAMAWFVKHPEMFGTTEAEIRYDSVSDPVFRAACGNVYQRYSEEMPNLSTKQPAELLRIIRNNPFDNIPTSDSLLVRYDVGDKPLPIRMPVPLNGEVPESELYSCNYKVVTDIELSYSDTMRLSHGYLPGEEPSLLRVTPAAGMAILAYRAHVIGDAKAAAVYDDIRSAIPFGAPSSTDKEMLTLQKYLFSVSGKLSEMRAVLYAAMAEDAAEPQDNLPIDTKPLVMTDDGDLRTQDVTVTDEMSGGRPVLLSAAGEKLMYAGGGIYVKDHRGTESLSFKNSVDNMMQRGSLGTLLWNVARNADLLFFSRSPDLAFFAKHKISAFSANLTKEPFAALLTVNGAINALPLSNISLFKAAFEKAVSGITAGKDAISLKLIGASDEWRRVISQASVPYSKDFGVDLSNEQELRKCLEAMSKASPLLALGVLFCSQQSQLVRFAEEIEASHKNDAYMKRLRQEVEEQRAQKILDENAELEAKLRLIPDGNVTLMKNELIKVLSLLGVKVHGTTQNWVANKVLSVTFLPNNQFSSKQYGGRTPDGYVRMMSAIVQAVLAKYPPSTVDRYTSLFYKFVGSLGLTALSATRAQLFTDTKTPELHVSATRDRNTVVVTCREPSSTDQTMVAFDLNDLNGSVTEHNLYKLASMWKSNISGALSVFQLSENISKELSDILKMYKDSTGPTALTSVVALDKAFLSYGRPAKWRLSTDIAVAFDLTGDGDYARALGEWTYGDFSFRFFVETDGAVRINFKNDRGAGVCTDWTKYQPGIFINYPTETGVTEMSEGSRKRAQTPEVLIDLYNIVDYTSNNWKDTKRDELEGIVYDDFVEDFGNGEKVLAVTAEDLVSLLHYELPAPPVTVEGKPFVPEDNLSLFTTSWPITASVVEVQPQSTTSYEYVPKPDRNPKQFILGEYPLLVGIYTQDEDPDVLLLTINYLREGLVFEHSLFPDQYLVLTSSVADIDEKCWVLVGKNDKNVHKFALPQGDILVIRLPDMLGDVENDQALIEYSGSGPLLFQYVFKLKYTIAGKGRELAVSAYFQTSDYDPLYNDITSGKDPDTYWYNYGYELTGNTALEPERTEDEQKKVDEISANNAELRQLNPEVAFDDAVIFDVAPNRISYLADIVKARLVVARAKAPTPSADKTALPFIEQTRNVGKSIYEDQYRSFIAQRRSLTQYLETELGKPLSLKQTVTGQSASDVGSVRDTIESLVTRGLQMHMEKDKVTLVLQDGGIKTYGAASLGNVGFAYAVFLLTAEGKVEQLVTEAAAFAKEHLNQRIIRETTSNGKPAFLVESNSDLERRMAGKDTTGTLEIHARDKYAEYLAKMSHVYVENAKFAAKQDAKQAVVNALDSVEKDYAEDVDGYTDTLSPMQRGKVLKVLNTPLPGKGNALRKEKIREAVSNGGYIKSDVDGEHLLIPDPNGGGDFYADWATKTGVDYAKYLIAKNVVDANDSLKSTGIAIAHRLNSFIRDISPTGVLEDSVIENYPGTIYEMLALVNTKMRDALSVKTPSLSELIEINNKLVKVNPVFSAHYSVFAHEHQDLKYLAEAMYWRVALTETPIVRYRVWEDSAPLLRTRRNGYATTIFDKNGNDLKTNGFAGFVTDYGGVLVFLVETAPGVYAEFPVNSYSISKLLDPQAMESEALSEEAVSVANAAHFIVSEKPSFDFRAKETGDSIVISPHRATDVFTKEEVKELSDWLTKFSFKVIDTSPKLKNVTVRSADQYAHNLLLGRMMFGVSYSMSPFERNQFLESDLETVTTNINELLKTSRTNAIKMYAPFMLRWAKSLAHDRTALGFLNKTATELARAKR